MIEGTCAPIGSPILVRVVEDLDDIHNRTIFPGGNSLIIEQKNQVPRSASR